MKMMSTVAVFNNAAHTTKPETEAGVVMVIRSDEQHATQELVQNIAEHMKSLEPNKQKHSKIEKKVESLIHRKYMKWKHQVLDAKADCLDYKQHGITDIDEQYIKAIFYDAEALAKQTVVNAEKLADKRFGQDRAPTVYISLDDMIRGNSDQWQDLAYSRIFNLAGNEHYGYTGRPGYEEIDTQLDSIRQHLQDMCARYGVTSVPVVLMEDNVRRSGMLNWITDYMDQKGIFDHAELCGISTCFCCADDDELSAIRLRDKIVPVERVIDFTDHKIDVVTPRDYLFDGMVVNVNDQKTRLPVIFMDVEERCRIAADKVDEFRERVRDINISFCEEVENKFGIDLPLEWFKGNDAMTHVTGIEETQRMVDVMNTIQIPAKTPPPTPAQHTLK